MPGVCRHGLGIERPSADEFGNCHAQVGQQANSRDPYARVIFIGGCEICAVVVMVVMSMAPVTVTMTMITMIAGLLRGLAHDCRQLADASADRCEVK